MGLRQFVRWGARAVDKNTFAAQKEQQQQAVELLVIRSD